MQLNWVQTLPLRVSSSHRSSLYRCSAALVSSRLASSINNRCWSMTVLELRRICLSLSFRVSLSLCDSIIIYVSLYLLFYVSVCLCLRLPKLLVSVSFAVSTGVFLLSELSFVCLSCSLPVRLSVWLAVRLSDTSSFLHKFLSCVGISVFH